MKPDEIKALRAEHRLTQRQAAKLALTPLRTWQAWEQGTHKMHPAIYEYLRIVLRMAA